MIKRIMKLNNFSLLIKGKIVKILESKDLIFKTEISQEDVVKLHQNVFCHEECAKYMLWKPNKNIEWTIQRLKRWTNNEYEFYYIYEKATLVPIGFLTFFKNETTVKNIGLCVGKDYFRKGYGKQSLKSLINYCKIAGVKLIEYSAFHDNVASTELAKSNGFEFVYNKKSIREHDKLEFVEDVFELKL